MYFSCLKLFFSHHNSSSSMFHCKRKKDVVFSVFVLLSFLFLLFCFWLGIREQQVIHQLKSFTDQD